MSTLGIISLSVIVTILVSVMLVCVGLLMLSAFDIEFKDTRLFKKIKLYLERTV